MIHVFKDIEYESYENEYHTGKFDEKDFPIMELEYEEVEWVIFHCGGSDSSYSDGTYTTIVEQATCEECIEKYILSTLAELP